MLFALDAAYSWAYGLGNALLIRLAYPLATCAIFLMLELLLPRQRNSRASYWRGISPMAGTRRISRTAAAAAQNAPAKQAGATAGRAAATEASQSSPTSRSCIWRGNTTCCRKEALLGGSPWGQAVTTKMRGWGK
jgi:hypothetical protein